MTARNAALLAGCLSSLLLAQDQPASNSAATRTERLDFPAGGLLHLKRPLGEVVIEGWDEPGMEIAVTKTPPPAYDAEGREKSAPAAELDRIRVTTERQGNEIVVATAGPGSRVFPPRATAGGISVTYRIHIPRTAGVIADRAEGEVHIDGLSGDIRVTARRGEITLQLPADTGFTLDARSRAGDVISDYAGHKIRRPWLLGHGFAPEDQAAGHKVYLRIGFGDILISKSQKAPLPAPISQPAAAGAGQ